MIDMVDIIEWKNVSEDVESGGASQPHDRHAFGLKTLGKVRSDEPGASRDDRTLAPRRHASLPRLFHVKRPVSLSTPANLPRRGGSRPAGRYQANIRHGVRHGLSRLPR